MRVEKTALRYVLDSIEDSQNQKQMGNLIFELRDLYQLTNIVYHASRIEGSTRKNPILLLTYDPQWVQQYTTREYFEIDPVVIAGRKSVLPIDWSRVDRNSSQARKFFKEAENYGVGRQGYTMPIRTYKEDTALFTFTSNVADDDWEKFREIRKSELFLIGHHLHEKIVALSGLRNDDMKPRITPQELKCMQYLASGQTPKEIARLMDLSLSTVRLHLNNARQKLFAATPHEAVARMVKYGLVKL